MKEYLKKSWYFWIWIIFEILGQKLIGRNSSLYPFFTAGVIAIFELYILLKLPYSERLWIYEGNANDPKCIYVRWMGLIPILASSYFFRTTGLGFVIYPTILERCIFYFIGTELYKNKVKTDLRNSGKAIAIITIIILGIIVYYGYIISRDFK